LISQAVAPLYPVDRADPAQPAVDYAYADGRGRVGFINPVSEPFCGDCNRLRITADGKLRNCLFSTAEWDVRQLLRSGADDEAIQQTVRDCVWHKKPAHGIDTPQFQRPERAMYQIGG
jgi:cyclic pyranopterin phosphate synthase